LCNTCFRYSTRQLTWFKGDKRWLWFNTQLHDGAMDVEACAGRLMRALECESPEASPEFARQMPPLTAAEVR